MRVLLPLVICHCGSDLIPCMGLNHGTGHLLFTDKRDLVELDLQGALAMFATVD